ncbi:MAG: M48 family metallopeptidase [Candidatus Berkelbacteria bacterium]
MNLYTHIDENKRRTVFIMIFFVIFVMGLGWTLSYVYGNSLFFVIALVVVIVQTTISYYAGDKIALSASGAVQIQKKDNPLLWNLVENLAITAGLPMPKVYIINDPAPNAFATGRDPSRSSVAVTTGLLEQLDKSEIEGVVAHEMSHIGNYDICLMMVVSVLVGVVALLADLVWRFQFFFGGRRDNDNNSGGGIMALIGIVAIILAPIVAMIVQLAISRKREYLADASGALLTRYPEGLASALEKIGSYKEPMQNISTSTSHLFIGDPNGKSTSFFANLFSTHPPIEERVKILRGMK